MRLGESTRKRGLAPDGSVVFPAFPRPGYRPFVIAGERTPSGPALEIHGTNRRFATEKLVMLYHYFILSLQRTEIMHLLRPPVWHKWEEKGEIFLVFCAGDSCIAMR